MPHICNSLLQIGLRGAEKIDKVENYKIIEKGSRGDKIRVILYNKQIDRIYSARLFQSDPVDNNSTIIYLPSMVDRI